MLPPSNAPGHDAGDKAENDGAHFTPPDLARLVAERVAALDSGLKGPLLHCSIRPAATATCFAP